MDSHTLFIAVGIAALLILALLKVVAPRAYDKYVLRDSDRPAPSLSVRFAGIVILSVTILIAVRFGLDVSQGARHKLGATRPGAQQSMALHAEAWVGLLCVSVTGIVLIVFPVGVTTRLLKGRLHSYPVDDLTTRKLGSLGRAVGILLLIAATLIAGARF